MRKQVIAYLHTHWDREWYREFEIFRMRLVRVFDKVLHLLENNRIPSFYFDGQVSALEDYLEIRPEKEEQIRRLVREKKLFIGPFYCLVDEFLTDRTSFAKNLELGMKKAIDFGCTDFIGYLADTFGHSKNVCDVLREFGIDKAIVWRGCGDFPAEFKWCGMDTVNLVRGYFNDIFSMKCDIEKKAEILKKNLDLIAEKSSSHILLPIGADHLGVEEDILDQIISINEILKEDYHIKLGSPFDYFRCVSSNFEDFEFNDELRDNSKTFVLQGAYSSRLDLKRYNIECMHALNLSSRAVRFFKASKHYDNLLDYAYKMLIRNQAHDSICGCSTDDVHAENITRYKKILQIAETIIDELKFENKLQDGMIINLSDRNYSGPIKFSTSKNLEGFQKIDDRAAFEKSLLTDTQRIPVTEDYTIINDYLAIVNDIEPDKIEFVIPDMEISDLKISNNMIGNSNIRLKIDNNKLFINNIPFYIKDFVDNGDSYNVGPMEDDLGTDFIIQRTRILVDETTRAILKIDFEGKRDVVSLIVTLDKKSEFINFKFDWTNTTKNHILQAVFEMPELIRTVYSEDMDILIQRSFEPNYDIRKNLPTIKGLEAKTNSAPMQRGLLIDEGENNIGVVTKGLTQYEVFVNKLYIPILRSTGIISNPFNSSRTTPAGPPIETPALQMLGKNAAEFNIFFGSEKDFENVIRKIYNYIITT